MRFVAVNSKYSLVSHIYELGIFNDALTHTHQSCPHSRHAGPEGCLPASSPNIFPLAKENFAKEKMFWNFIFSQNLFVVTLSPEREEKHINLK